MDRISTKITEEIDAAETARDVLDLARGRDMTGDAVADLTRNVWL
jgi:hypothetical protein